MSQSKDLSLCAVQDRRAVGCKLIRTQSWFHSSKEKVESDDHFNAEQKNPKSQENHQLKLSDILLVIVSGFFMQKYQRFRVIRLLRRAVCVSQEMYWP